jgi:predicted NUDIX family NTP pyrophosphohydrolase
MRLHLLERRARLEYSAIRRNCVDDVAMAAHSAGILLHRASASAIEVWLGHMGGPFWARKQKGSWSIPKGEAEAGESGLAVAVREFSEEIGSPAPDVDYVELGTFRYSSGKTVTVYAGEAPDFDPSQVVSNTFDLEWPPRSGRIQRFPELDQARWVPAVEARELLVVGQRPALDALMTHLGIPRHEPEPT